MEAPAESVVVQAGQGRPGIRLAKSAQTSHGGFLGQFRGDVPVVEGAQLTFRTLDLSPGTGSTSKANQAKVDQQSNMNAWQHVLVEARGPAQLVCIACALLCHISSLKAGHISGMSKACSEVHPGSNAGARVTGSIPAQAGSALIGQQCLLP